MTLTSIVILYTPQNKSPVILPAISVLNCWQRSSAFAIINNFMTDNVFPHCILYFHLDTQHKTI